MLPGDGVGATHPWREVLGRFGLPPPVDPPAPVPGGWSHRVWRVETAEGTYAVKELVENPASWWAEQLQVAVAFESAAWRSGQVPMAEPVTVAGSDGLVGRLGRGRASRCYRCHRWVEGRPCLELAPDLRRAAQVGRIVAGLARLDIRCGTTAEHLPWNALDAYDETVAEATSSGRDWAGALADLRPHVARLREELEDLAARRLPMVVLHRDVDPKNCATRPDGTLALFDWDSAGPRQPGAELLDAALSFAGGPIDAREDCVRRTVEAYREAGGPEVDVAQAAGELVEGSFRWLMLNAWRALGHRPEAPAGGPSAASLVRALAPTWAAAAEATRRWAARV